MPGRPKTGAHMSAQVGSAHDPSRHRHSPRDGLHRGYGARHAGGMPGDFLGGVRAGGTLRPGGRGRRHVAVVDEPRCSVSLPRVGRWHRESEGPTARRCERGLRRPRAQRRSCRLRRAARGDRYRVAPRAARVHVGRAGVCAQRHGSRREVRAGAAHDGACAAVAAPATCVVVADPAVAVTSRSPAVATAARSWRSADVDGVLSDGRRATLSDMVGAGRCRRRRRRRQRSRPRCFRGSGSATGSLWGRRRGPHGAR